MSGENSTQSLGDTSANLEDPFLALLQDISPYIDAILTKPEFHRFLDLPLELRCKIYDQYFLDNTDSVACKTWPTLLIDRMFSLPEQGRQTRRAFLPKLCLVSPMHLDCEYITQLTKGSRFLQESLKNHCLLGYIRHISIRKINHCYMRVIDGLFSDDEESDFDISERCETPKGDFSTMLPKFLRLRQLSLGVHAPLRHMGYVSNASNLECVRAQPIDSYLDGFDFHTLFEMKELTKLTITGSAGSDNCPDEFLVPALTVIKQYGKIENLQRVKDLAREIKDGFRDRDQDVVVEFT